MYLPVARWTVFRGVARHTLTQPPVRHGKLIAFATKGPVFDFESHHIDSEMSPSRHTHECAIIKTVKPTCCGMCVRNSTLLFYSAIGQY